MVGILRCGKMLPPQLNLVIEIEFADATTALWSENAGAHPSGATLSTDFGLCAGRVLQPGAPLRKVARVQLPHAAHAAVQRPEQRGGTQRHRGARLHETHGRVCDFLGQPPKSTCWPGQDVAPIGAAKQDSLLESQMQLGSLQYPHNPMKGASEWCQRPLGRPCPVPLQGLIHLVAYQLVTRVSRCLTKNDKKSPLSFAVVFD